MTVYLLIDKRGKVHGRFQTAYGAAAYAEMRWPKQEQDPEETGIGWNVREENCKS